MGLLAPYGSTSAVFEPTRPRRSVVGCEGEVVGRGMEGEGEGGAEAEEGGEGGMEGGGSPGGSCSVRFARGVAGESSAMGVEGARFGARSSSIRSCSCCEGTDAAVSCTPSGSGGGGSGSSGSVDGSSCSGSSRIDRRQRFIVCARRRRIAAWKSFSREALLSQRREVAAQPLSFPALVDLGSGCSLGWRSVHTTPCSSTE